MKIIIISDSHDNLKELKKIIEFANKNGDLLIHCGDLCSPFTAKELLNLKIPFIYIFGNNDAERDKIKDILSKKGKVFECLINKIGKYNFFIYHGTNLDIIKNSIDTQLFDFIIYGHTHKWELKKKEKSIIINPGELCGYLTGKSTFALLDLYNKNVKILINKKEPSVLKEIKF
jgi:putative phosphoesterase